MNGQDREALDAMGEALHSASDEQRTALQAEDRDLRLAIAGSEAKLAAAERELAALSARVNKRRTFRFANDSMQFLHGATVDLLHDLDVIANGTSVAVAQRLEWARRITELTLHHPNARVSWADARAAIAAADGVVASRLYQGAAIALRDEDLTGLVPIGMNPATKLWEFYELRSAWDGVVDPATIAIPSHGPDGSIAVDETTGIVFVLLPGGTFLMGAQRMDPGLPNYAEDADGQQWPHAVALAPFLLARHELTQGQWERLWNGARDARWPGVVRGERLPVEQVDWHECDRTLTQQGMELPTEAQWEYACRAGTTTPWSCAWADLGRCAHFDAARAVGLPRPPLPVGSLSANAFGLFDMHGNVAEWCRDPNGSYADPVLPGDALRLAAGDERVYRGGDFTCTASGVTSHVRHATRSDARSQTLGVRAARRLSR
ncbi:MAG TPA: SUMF1/EgtB/PvdO family nonheme iron enzyme [Planctomycetota bacterium]|nr:SUMF1/EgtB/PvdO family nonheme iron enzyme [Planctomycetota bacterium]